MPGIFAEPGDALGGENWSCRKAIGGMGAIPHVADVAFRDRASVESSNPPHRLLLGNDANGRSPNSMNFAKSFQPGKKYRVVG